MSTFLLAAAIVVATVALMELFAWWAHKYVMHSWGWGWHRSHHEPHDDTFERNDLYAAVFAGVAMLLFWIGTDIWIVWWIAIGITAYGALYFVAHDGLVHHRWPFRYVPKSGYLKRLYQAHRLHHAVRGKDGCVSFGFLWAPPLDALKARLRRNQRSCDVKLYDSERDLLADDVGSDPQTKR